MEVDGMSSLFLWMIDSFVRIGGASAGSPTTLVANHSNQSDRGFIRPLKGCL